MTGGGTAAGGVGPDRFDDLGSVPAVPFEPSVPGLLRHAVGRAAGADLLVTDTERLTYAAADRRSRVLAGHLLAAGAGKGTRIGLLFPNSAAFVVSWLAVTRIGAVAVPLSTFVTAAELRTLCVAADVHLLMSADGYLSHDYAAVIEAAFPGCRDREPAVFPEAPFLRTIWVAADGADPAPPVPAPSEVHRDLIALVPEIERQVTPSDVATIIHTSGSTAAPKGVVHSHGTLLRQAWRLASTRSIRPDDRVFTSMPYFWVGGLVVGLLVQMQVGAASLVSATTEPGQVLDFLERERVTQYQGWPHAARALTAHPSFPQRSFPGFRGGSLLAALPPDRRPDPKLICEGLGMTETAGPHTVGQMRVLPPSLRGSFGVPAPGMAHRIVAIGGETDVPDGEPGELLVRGDSLMLGINKRERQDVFTEDGWYRTGDVVVRRDGHLFYQGRLDDVVKVRGTNVSPREVEAALTALEGVRSAYVTGVATPRGTELGAVVAVRDGVMDADGLRAALRTRLSSYKVPRVLRLVEPGGVPRSTSGKVDRRALVELLQEAADGDGAR